MRSTILLALGAALLLGAPLEAHGGVYRGPSGRFPGGNVPAPPRGPRTGSTPSPDEMGTSWQFWWEYNKDPFLRLKQAVNAVDDVGVPLLPVAGQTRAGLASLAPSPEEIRDLVLPALKKLLDSSDHQDIATACMIAIAKIGVDHPDFGILPIFKERLARDNLEVRETAALCLGIARRPEALDDLRALALDQRAGRKLVERESVEDRVRAFSCYALGLIASSSDDVEVERRALEVFGTILSDKKIKSDDVRVAAIQGIGLLGLDPSESGHKRLLWEALDVLAEFYRRDFGPNDQIMQAHVPTAVARLCGRGVTAEHERFKKLFVAELDDEKKRHRTVVQSAAIALGKLCEPGERAAGDARYSKALLDYAQGGDDPQAQRFAVIALGEIGGERNRSELLRYFGRAHRLTMRPWAALALGVLTFHAREQSGEVDETVGRALRAELREVDVEDTEAAIAVALGLCGYLDAVSDMRKLLRERRHREVVAGYLCIGLALLQAQAAIEDVREVVGRADRRPFLLSQSTVALALLGDKDVGQMLLDILSGESHSVGTLSVAASAFRFVGDRRAIRPLIDLMFSKGPTTLARAFVAISIGGIADPSELPWSARISVGTNYHAVVPTLSNGTNGVLDIL